MTEKIEPQEILHPMEKSAFADGINRKTIPIGSICFYVDRYPRKNDWMLPNWKPGKWFVRFGKVEEHYPGQIVIQLYEPKDFRTVNGVPIKEFVTPTEWQKLPKGWTYDTKLFCIDSAKCTKNGIDLSKIKVSLDDPNEIQKLIDNGIYVKVEENDHCILESQIERGKGWRIIRRYEQSDYRPWSVTVPFTDVFCTFQEAAEVVAEHDRQLAEEAAMSDLDWSKNEIKKTVFHWAQIYCIPSDQRNAVLDRLYSMENLEDLEIRMFGDDLQWKYCTHRRWSSVKV